MQNTTDRLTQSIVVVVLLAFNNPKCRKNITTLIGMYSLSSSKKDYSTTAAY